MRLRILNTSLNENFAIPSCPEFSVIGFATSRNAFGSTKAKFITGPVLKRLLKATVSGPIV